MKDERYLKDEFGRLPEEFPELRENFTPPLDEEFKSEAEYPGSMEAASPGPQFTPPGAPVPAVQEEGSRRIIRKLILYLVAAALGIFIYLGPFGNLMKRFEPFVPGSASAQLDELVKPGAPKSKSSTPYAAAAPFRTIIRFTLRSSANIPTTCRRR